MDATAATLAVVLAAYLGIGVVSAVAFVTVGVNAVQPAPLTLAVRALLLPGAVLLWPLVLWRWRKLRRPA